MKFYYLFFLLLIFCCKKCDDVEKKSYLNAIKHYQDSLAIVFTNNMEGYIEPCGCNANPLGGLARFTTVFRDFERIIKEPVILIDGGNLLFEHETENPGDECQNEAKRNLLLKTLTSLGLDFTTIGKLDLTKQEKYYKETYQKYNIKYHEIKTIKKNDVNISIIGIDESIKNINSFKEQLKNLKSTSKKQIVILVSTLLWPKTKELFGYEPYIDIIIQAKALDYVPKSPERPLKDGPLVFFGGRQGQYFTALLFNNLENLNNDHLVLDDRSFLRQANKELLKFRTESLKEQIDKSLNEKKEFLKKRLEAAKEELLVLEKEEKDEKPLSKPNVLFFTTALNRLIENDYKVKNEMDEYQKEIPLLVKKCEDNIVCPKLNPNEPYYVGVMTCKNCHEEAYKVWQNAVYTLEALNENGQKIKREVGHSKAWKTLSDLKKDSDRSCIGCHSVGFMEKGGYCKAKEVDFRKDVQCESCHGPGSLHAQSGKKDFIKRAVSESDCRACHHTPHITSYESFNYEEQLMKILGPGHGEKLLLKLQHQRDDKTS